VETKRAILPPTYLLVTLLTMAALHLVLPVAWIIPLPWSILGALPAAAGIVLNLLADRALKQAQTTVKPFQPSRTLVTSGVYALTRHPMYLGYVLILLGVAVMLRCLTPFLLIPVFAALMERVFIRAEEDKLMAAFGEDYSRYGQKVGRWV
jgi:protein-S-isoprenylcysteine O-methyltransferase Ste14